ncbi:hypothetical protein Tco_0373579 [Tanacetum coccineum]
MDLSSLIKMPDPTAVREVVREPEPSTILSPLIEDLSLTRDRLAFLDRKAATMSDTEWMILIAQLRASPEVAMEVLGMDSTHPSFDEEIEERIRRRNSALSDIHYRAQQDKIMSQGDSTEYMRRYIKNMSANYYGSGKTMEWAKKFVGQELIDEYTQNGRSSWWSEKPKDKSQVVGPIFFLLFYIGLFCDLVVNCWPKRAGLRKDRHVFYIVRCWLLLRRRVVSECDSESENLRESDKEPNFKKVAIELWLRWSSCVAKPDSSSRGSDAESFFDDLLVCRDKNNVPRRLY